MSRRSMIALYFAAVTVCGASATAQTISIVDGIVVVEDTGSRLLTHHRPLALRQSTTLALTPNSQNSFDVETLPFSWTDNIGRLIVDREQGTDWVNIELGFQFRLGGRSFGTARVSRRGCVTFGDAANSPITLFDERAIVERQYYLLDAVSDATPRLCPLFIGPIHGVSHRFMSAFARTDATEAVFTWRGSGIDPTNFGPIAFQLVLRPSGAAFFRYDHLEGADYGAVLAVTGGEPWWSSERPFASVPNSQFTTSALLRSAELLQLGDTNVLIARFTSVGPIPSNATLGVEFFSDRGLRESRGRSYAALDNGSWKQSLEIQNRQWAIEFRQIVRVRDDQLQFAIAVEDFAAAGASFAVRFYACNPTCSSWLINENLTLTDSRDIRTSFETRSPAGRGVPLLNVFTNPTIDRATIRQQLLQRIGTNWEHAFIFSNFDHGDGSSTMGGNIGVDGLGDSTRSSSTRSRSPAMTVTNFLPRDLKAFRMCQHLLHGFGHMWLAYTALSEEGRRTTSLNSAGSGIHWGFNVNANAAFPIISPREWSVMGGMSLVENSDGIFDSWRGSLPYPECGFSWLDLYLMGLAAPSEVPESFYIRNAEWVPGSVNPRLRGAKVAFTINQVIEANGARVPDHNASQKSFTTPFVLFLREGERLSADMLERIQTVRLAFVANFIAAVGGRASITSTVQDIGMAPR